MVASSMIRFTVALLSTSSAIAIIPATFLLILQYPTKDLNITFNLSETVELECIVSSLRHPQFTWLKANDSTNTTLTSSGSIGISNTEKIEKHTLPNGTVLLRGYRETLTITEASQEDAGTYFCAVRTSWDSKSVKIELKAATLERVHGTVDVSISSSKPVGVYLGDQIELHCHANVTTGEIVSYRWEHMDYSTVLSEVSNTLTISQLSVNHLGTYQCYVECESGTGQGNVTLSLAKNIIERNEYGMKIRKHKDCPSSGTNEDITVDILQLLAQEFGVSNTGRSQTYAASSCQQIKANNPNAKIGLYWIKYELSVQKMWCEF